MAAQPTVLTMKPGPVHKPRKPWMRDQARGRSRSGVYRAKAEAVENSIIVRVDKAKEAEEESARFHAALEAALLERARERREELTRGYEPMGLTSRPAQPRRPLGAYIVTDQEAERARRRVAGVKPLRRQAKPLAYRPFAEALGALVLRAR